MMRRAEAIGLRRGVDKNHPADPRLRQVAIATMEAQQRRVASMPESRERQALTTAWTELGPNPIPNGQSVSGPQLAVSGRTVAIAVHPTDPNIVYVGTAQGGLYRSTNGGTTWTPLLDNALSLAINTVAIAPSQPDTIFVGTGETAFSSDSFFGVGIYRIDNASTATPIVTGPIGAANFTAASIGKIVVHPTNPDIIFVASTIGGGGGIGLTTNGDPETGLYRSTDALSGAPTFTKLDVAGVAFPYDGTMLDIVIDPVNPDLLLCTKVDLFGDGDGGVYRTTNALAATPTFARTFTAGVGIGLSRTELALHRSGAGVVTVYAATAASGGSVQRSTDGGATWALRINNSFCGGQCFYNIGVAVDPTSADHVYLGGTGMTTTFGISINAGFSFTNSQSGLHTDTQAIAVAPSLPSTIYFGSDGGIYKSTDSGTTWATLNNATFKATQFWSVAVHPTDPNFSIGGTQDNGTNFYHADATWTRADFGDGGYSLIDQNATDTTNVRMYHTYFNNSGLQGYATVATSAAAMEGSWTFRGCSGAGGNGIPCGGAVLFYAPLEQGPGNPNTTYYGANILYRSSDTGLNHTPVSQNLTDPISAIGISPQDDNVRIVGQSSGGIWGTTTGSTTLTNLDASNVVPDSFVARAVIDPNNVNTAYVTLSAFGVTNVWKTTNLNNAAPTWTAAAGSGANILPQVPVSAFLVDPTDSNTLFAGTDIGVYTSTDGGANWTPFGTGLPRVAVFDMAIQPTSRILRIATHGRGLWQIPLRALQFTEAVSRKTHGGAGTFDVALPLVGTPGIECRDTGGNHTLVFTFTNDVVSGSASVTSGTGSVMGSPTFSSNTMSVNLTGVTNAQQIAVNLSGVTDVGAQVLSDTTVNMIALAGDTTGNKAVNSSDVSQTKLQSGAPVNGVVGAANFRNDVSVDGSINSTDISMVKLNTGTAVP